MSVLLDMNHKINTMHSAMFRYASKADTHKEYGYSLFQTL